MTTGKPLSTRTKITLAAAILLTLAGVILQVIPGMKFSGELSLATAAGCLAWEYLCGWAEHSDAGKRWKRVFVACVAAGLLLFAALEVLLLSYAVQDNRDAAADAVIVLGAGVNGDRPSLALQTRIDAAADYLSRHPGVPVALSGGQGPGELLPEAQVMYDALRVRFPDRTFLVENRSTSTAENFAYSKTLLEETGVDTDNAVIAVVTNDFHVLRADLIAQRQGLRTVGVAAPLPYGWLTVNYYIREAFALVKTFLLDW